MPDLDAELRSLRERMFSSIPQPDLDGVAQRYRQRVVRRRTQLGAAVAVLVVAMAVPILRGQSTTDSAVPAEPPASTDQPAPAHYEVEFADAKHGYALRDSCAGSPSACEFDLLVTADGQNWARRESPLPQPPTEPRNTAPGLLVLGPDSLALTYTVEAVGPEISRYLSSDAGRTWRPVPESLGSAVSAIPAGAPLIAICPREPSSVRDCDDLGTVLPESGQSVPLASQPPLDEVRPGAIPTMDGSWWAAGRDPATLDWMVAVSRDAGRTWTTGKIAKAGKQYAGDWADVVELNATLYAFVDGFDGGGLLSVFESTDGGATWIRTWDPTGKDPIDYIPPAVAAADEKLLVYSLTDRTTFASSDGGRTFVEAPGRLTGLVEWTRAGYLETADEMWNAGYRLSADGVRWREMSF